MAFTVGIATTGEDPPRLCDTINGVIRSARSVSADAEVLVVVNGRGRLPELDGIDSPLLRVRYLERRGVAVARNAVLDEARHDTILFTDDDCAVPPEWCAQLTSGLWEPGWAAVGAPVRLEVGGPVSAYYDYLRGYDAFPLGVDGPLLLVTTNCGLRRDLIGGSLRFDPCVRNAGAEDTAFALELGKAGLRARWLGEATPIRHGFSEGIAEITERSLRNARNAVHLYLEHGMVESAMPGLLGHFRQRAREDSPFDRRFGEFVVAEARTAMAVYDVLTAAATAIGYLDQFGIVSGHALLELDLDGLRQAWVSIAEQVTEQASALSAAAWAAPELDYRGMRDRLAPEPLVAEVWHAVRRYARPIDADPVGPVGDLLTFGAAATSGDALGTLARMRKVYDELCAGPDVSADDLERLARANGMSFKTALDAMEFSFRIDVDAMVSGWRSRRRPPTGAPPDALTDPPADATSGAAA